MIKDTPLFAESWNVAWRVNATGTILDDKKTSFRVIKNSLRYWAADPFVFMHKGSTYVFAELYDYVQRKGCIGFCEIVAGATTKWIPVIVEDWHLSFPFIYEEGGNIYIIPESSENNEICRYVAVDFPYRWKKDKVLRSEIKCVDTVLLGKSYNQAITYKQAGNGWSLVLLTLDHDEQDVTICVDNEKTKRPAGRILQDSDIRMAQNCIEDYGTGLVAYRYDLSDAQYSEVEIERIFPEDINLDKKLYRCGMHTYNKLDNIEVIDIKTRRFNLVNLTFRLIGKICAIFGK